MTGAPGGNSTLITLALIAFVVARFLFRELRDQKILIRNMVVVPALLAALAGWLGWMALERSPNLALFGGEIVIAIVAGLGLGLVVSHFSTVRLAGPGVVIVRGSVQTVVLWLVAFGIRFALRLFMKGESAADALAGNAALVALVAAALAMRRYRIFLDARRLAAAGQTGEVRVL